MFCFRISPKGLFVAEMGFLLQECFVLFCFVLFCFVLFCFVLFCFVLFCLINCWSSVVSVVLPQLCNLHCMFCFVLFCLLGFLVQNLYSISPKG